MNDDEGEIDIMGYTSQIPALDAGHVTSATRYSDAHLPHYACDPSKSLIGISDYNCWASGEYYINNQEFIIIYDSEKIIKRIYYQNFQDAGGGAQSAGARDFLFLGWNGSSWIQLVTSQSYFNQHTGADEPDPRYITVDNDTGYFKYKFLFLNNYGSEYTLGVRRIELQTEDEPPPPSGDPPSVITAAITAITASTASGGGNVTSDGSGTVSARGVCWSTSENPTIADAKTTDGSGTGPFTSSLAGLTAPTIYYARAWATNEYGTGYGIQTSFSTIALPTVTTKSPASRIKNSSANVHGAIVSTGGVDPTVRGVCYNTTGAPTTADSKTEEAGTFAVGSFSEALAGLTRSTLYYARAYATNTEGTAYGVVITFTTLSVESIAEPQLRLSDTFYLPRAGRYADPQNTNDNLPMVYGDLTDGAAGIWQLPCIDIVNFVYCFSAFPVLSAANGNSINIYVDNALVDAEDYTFDEDNNYESEGQIATITFFVGLSAVVRTGAGLNDMTAGGIFSGKAKAKYRVKITTAAATDKFDWSDDDGATWKATGVSITGAAQALNNDVTVIFAATTGHTLNDYFSFTARPSPENAAITARGKGKVLTGTTLMENIIDIVVDFLTVQNNFTADLFEATAKAKARQVFEAAGYAAAGVIQDDGEFWDIITEMMASFIGGAYLNGSGELVLEIDDGTMSLYGATIIRKGEAILLDVRQRLVNIINQCPAHYAYNYAEGAFKRETNTSAHADAISQGVHGVREPNEPLQLYWCRNITDAQAMQDIIVGKFKDPIYEIEIDVASLTPLPLDVGDYFVCTIDSLYEKDGSKLINNYWRIVSVMPDYSKNRIGFRALQTPYFMTVAYLADGTYLADGSMLAGNERDMTIY